MIRRLLIANRGEIARRITLAAREMSIETVALYTQPDVALPFVRMADFQVCVDADPPSQAYLRPDLIIDAARRTQADAVHPGYGFLSERSSFAQACLDAGLTFVGPSPQAMNAVGDKIGAKRLMAAAGVPVVPGYSGDDRNEDVLFTEAEKIGVPLLIKASGGGGGRGMRVVRDLAQFAGELAEAKREALAGFGDDRVLLERYVEHPRHIEFQIFGGADGQVIHLFERECSIQRRHQKIIEESPSPVMNPELRARMAEAAVAAGRAAGYQNAGTVEFLLEEHKDKEPTFYFLEVNARLQVEHPVTEMIAGVDLVKAQLRTASGLPHGMRLPSAPFGHAIEVRIYAEDPATGFLPSIGHLREWVEPHSPWVRVDSGVERGCEVGPYFDPMLAKVIAWGEDRREAIARMIAALKSMAVLGIETNIGYLLDILSHPDFQAGEFSIRFLDEQFQGWRPNAVLVDDVFLALAAQTVLPTKSQSPASSSREVFDPWKTRSGWRNVAGTAR